MRFNGLSMLAACAAVALLSACSGSSSDSNNDETATGSGDGTATFSLNVTDAPIDSALAVVVEFDGVVLKRDGAEDLEFTFDPPKSIDLLALQGTDSQPLLDAVEIPEGTYNSIRLQVNAEFDSNLDSYITLVGGAQEELRVPSGSQSGLKLNTAFTVAAGSSDISLGVDAEYTIDFDLRKSIVKPNGQPGHFLKPSLRLVQNIQTGSITGVISPALLTGTGCDADPASGNAVYAYIGAGVTPDDVGSANEPLTTAMVKLDTESGDYTYELGFLSQGSYTVAYTCQASADFEADDENDPDNDPDDDISFDASADVLVIAGEEVEQDL